MMDKLLARNTGATDDFARLHRLFVEHFGIAVGLTWLASGVAALQAPWVRNLRGLIDPGGRPESTFSFLFGLPLLMTVGWLGLAFGADVMRRSQLFRSQTLEFGIAAVVAFAVFCMALQRAVAAFLLAV